MMSELRSSRRALSPRERRLRPWLMGAGVAIAALSRLLAEAPGFVEWHRVEAFPRIAFVLQAFSAPNAGTLGEIVWVILFAGLAFSLIRFGSRAVAPLVPITGLIVAAFYGSWGFAYHYAPLSERLPALAGDSGGEEARLVDVTRRAALLLARAYENEPDLGGPPQDVIRQVSYELDVAFEELPPGLDASPVRAVKFGPAKLSRVSSAMTRLHISGYFSPWTGEAQINAEMPRSLWPRVAAHELAHQRGFARENEATVAGTLACLISRDPRVFYGGALGLFVAFDRELSRPGRDAAARTEIWSLLPPKVVEHLEEESAFWKRYEGTASAVSEKVNDTYLKAQGVESGVQSYQETTRLFLQSLEVPALNLGARLGLSQP